jgi:hypothetical protein
MVVIRIYRMEAVMFFRLSEIILLPIAWATLVLGALQLKLLVSASAHSVCGPWGCGPETGALAAMHAGWLAAIGPPFVYFPIRLAWRKSSIRRLALGLVIVGLAGILGVFAWQWFVWLPQAGDFARNYFWQRCGFAIITAVDWPLLQLVFLAGILWLVSTVRQNGTKLL